MPIKEPERYSKRASKVRHRCINRNNKVEMFNHGCGVAKIDEVISPIDYAFA